MRRCYIVVRQLFFVSNGVLNQCEDDKSVRDVFTTSESAIEWARSYIQYFIDHSNVPLQMFEERPDSELIYKVGAINSSGIVERVYNVIKKGMMV